MKYYRKRRDPVELVILLLGGFLVVMLAFFMARGDLDAYTQLLLQGGMKEKTNQRVEEPLAETDYAEESGDLMSTNQGQRTLIIEEESAVEQKELKETITPAAIIPSPTPLTSPQPTSPPLQSTSPSTGKFYLQAGAFSSESNANSMANTLREMGFGATVEKSSNLFKVKIYGFNTKQEASAAVQKIKSKGIDAFIGQ